MFILLASYIFIFILFIATDAIPIQPLIKNKRLWMAVLSILMTPPLFYAWLIQGEKNVAPFLFLPLVVFLSSVYEIYRDKKAEVQLYNFRIPEHMYKVEKKLGVDLIPEARLKSTTELIWQNKRIIMPQTFSAEGEPLELVCIKSDEDNELYYCKDVMVLETRKSIGKRLVSLSLIISILSIPMCFYLSTVSALDYWIELAKGFTACAVFGFAKTVIYGTEGTTALRLLRVVINIFYIISVLGVFMNILEIILTK